MPSIIKRVIRATIWTLAVIVVTSPYAYLNINQLLESARYHLFHTRTDGSDWLMGYGRSWLFLFGFPVCLGIVGSFVFVLSCVNLLVTMWHNHRGRYEKTLLIASLLVFLAPLIPSDPDTARLYLRYLVPVAPLYSIIQALFLDRVVSHVTRAPLRNALLVALVAAIIIGPLVRSIGFISLIQNVDTRALARDFVEREAHTDGAVGVFPGMIYMAPKLRDGFTYTSVQFESGSFSPSYILVGSEVLTDSQKRLLQAHAELVASFSGQLETRPWWCRSPVYEKADAFYVPVSGFCALSRPGPSLQVYRVRE